MKDYYGNGIQFYRKISGIKQWVLAEHLGMSRQNLSEIEQNKRKISDNKIDLAAELLKTTPEKIKNFSGEIVFNNQHPQGEQYDNCIVSLPESVLAELIKVLELSRQSLQSQGDILKKCLKALQFSQAQASDLQARLLRLEDRGTGAAHGSNT